MTDPRLAALEALKDTITDPVVRAEVQSHIDSICQELGLPLPGYRVGGQAFSDFDDVIRWVWNTYKIDFSLEDEPTEEQKQLACKEFNELIASGNI